MFSPHAFRHTFATRCFEADIPPKTVQTLLGHASLQMTMDLYTSVLKDKKDADMQKFDGLLDKVFSCGDAVAEEKYESKLQDENKIIKFQALG